MMQAPKILWDNILNTATATLTSSGFTTNSVYNVTDWRTHTNIMSTSTYSDIRLDLGAGGGLAADCIGVAIHNLAGRRMRVRASDDGVSFSTLLNTTNLESDVIISTFARTTARYWKITLSSEATGAIVGVIALGTATEFPRPIAIGNSPINMGVELKSNRSQTGVLLGNTVKYHPISLNMSFNYLSATFFTDSSGNPANFGKFWYDHGRYAMPFFVQVSGDSFPKANYLMRLNDNYTYTMPMFSTGLVQSLSVDMISCQEATT